MTDYDHHGDPSRDYRLIAAIFAIGCAALAALDVTLFLRLGGVVTWSWWWVTSPLWGGSALIVLLVAGAFSYAAYRGD